MAEVSQWNHTLPYHFGGAKSYNFVPETGI